MDWIVPVSYEERTFGSLSPVTTRLAYEALQEHGCVLLRGVLQPRIVDEMHKDFLRHFGSLDASAMAAETKKAQPNPFTERGGKRYEITLEMRDAFGQPEVFANPVLVKFLMGLLRATMRLSSFSTVVSFPGASLQQPHRDHANLFPECQGGQVLPSYAINVSVPLIDIDVATGPTAIWLGSHRLSDGFVPKMETATIVPFQKGDAVLIDYRTIHAGLPNTSSTARPIVYMVYARTWFFDETNYLHHTALQMPIDVYRALPEFIHPLLVRVHKSAQISAREMKP